MKKIIACWIILMSPLMAQQETALPTQSKTQQIIDSKTQIDTPQESLDNRHEKWEVLPYGHIQVFLPGVGACFRTPSSPYRLEFDIKAATFGGTLNFVTGSISAMAEFPTTTGAYYVGVGGGNLTIDADGFEGNYGTESFPMVKFFVGYQGKRFFGDLGFDAIIPETEEPVPLPTMRFGTKF